MLGRVSLSSTLFFFVSMIVAVHVFGAENQVHGTITDLSGPKLTLQQHDGSLIELKISLSTDVVGEDVTGYGDLKAGHVVTADLAKAKRGDGMVVTKIRVMPQGQHD